MKVFHRSEPLYLYSDVSLKEEVEVFEAVRRSVRMSSLVSGWLLSVQLCFDTIIRLSSGSHLLIYFTFSFDTHWRKTAFIHFLIYENLFIRFKTSVIWSQFNHSQLILNLYIWTWSHIAGPVTVWSLFYRKDLFIF